MEKKQQNCEQSVDRAGRKNTVDVVGGKEAYVVIAFAFCLYFLEKLFQIWGKEGTGDVVAQATETAVSLVCPPST
jgi:hypothetical protein